MGMSGKWHFQGHPTEEEPCLLKLTDGDFILAEWDDLHDRWLDIGRDRSWFTGGVVCWVYVYDLDVPETLKEMTR